MNEKTCTGCLETKPTDAFAKKASTTSGFQARCKDCHSSYTRAHYAANKDYYKTKGKRNRRDIVEMVKLAKTCPCQDCGIEYPYFVMDFDHVRGDKVFNLSDCSDFGRNQVLAEIEKCDVICSNCHRIRTHQRQCSRSSTG